MYGSMRMHQLGPMGMTRLYMLTMLVLPLGPGKTTCTAGGEPHLPCALLVDHRCTAYPVRPLMCGGFNSGDAAACERFVRSSGQTPVPLYAPQLRLAAFVLDGMTAGLSESGLTGGRVELTAALRIALEVPDAVERFLAGEPSFAAAVLD